jgi:Helix-turn-helix domain
MTLLINPERLTKKQVCSILNIGYSTLGRWMREGKIKFSREQAAKFESAVFFRRDDLAEFLPTVAESATHPKAPAAHPTASRGDSPLHPEVALPYQDEPDRRDFAQKFRDGDECDSAGNYITGENPRYQSTGATLLGPVAPYTAPPVNRDTSSHMDPALVGRPGPSADECYLNSLERRRDLGIISQASYDALTSNASKARRLSGQQRKVYLDQAAIRAAFRHGFSR